MFQELRWMILKEPLHDIKPIKAVEWAFNDYFNKYRWVIIGAAAGLLLIVLAFIIYPWIKNKKYAKKRNRKILPAEEALHALSKLKQQKLWEKSTKAYYSELTNALRVYFEKKLKIDALESTSDEILEKMNPKLEKEEHQKLKTLLYESDMVKFAKSSPGESKHLNYMEDSVALIHSVEEKMDENTPILNVLERFRISCQREILRFGGKLPRMTSLQTLFPKKFGVNFIFNFGIIILIY